MFFTYNTPILYRSAKANRNASAVKTPAVNPSRYFASRGRASK